MPDEDFGPQWPPIIRRVEPSLHLCGEVMGGGSLDPGLVSSPEVIVWVAVGIFLFPSWDSKAGVLEK